MGREDDTEKEMSEEVFKRCWKCTFYANHKYCRENCSYFRVVQDYRDSFVRDEKGNVVNINLDEIYSIKGVHYSDKEATQIYYDFFKKSEEKKE